MAVERKTYTYTPFEYQDYKKSDEVITAGKNKTNAEKAYNTYLNTGYQKSQDVINAEKNKANAENALANYGDFSYGNQATLDDVMNKILNREKFSYDLNGDALYQQYKDQYMRQGNIAMKDAIGQAAAMTGGYGNSYAATVGNQAYQSYLQQLNDKIPELYQLALDKYNMEGQDLYNQYGMLSDDRNTQYGMWGDKRNMLAADRDYYSSDYYNAYNMDYGQWVDKGTMLNDNRTYYGNEYNNAFNRDYGMYSDNRNIAYNDHTTSEGYKYQDVVDANAYAQWKAEYDESVRQYNASLAEQQRQYDTTMAENVRQFNKSMINNIKQSSANNSNTTTPTLDASEYNDVLVNAGAYAEQGKTALKTYLNGMVSRGLSQDEAADIYEQYFPTLTTTKDDNTHKLTLMEKRMK